MKKVPYMIIAGDNEAETKTVSVRSRREGDLGSMSAGDLLDKLLDKLQVKR